MKKRTVVFVLIITLFIFSTASAEGIWGLFSGLTGPASAPVFREVELPPLEDVALLGVSPTGDYLAFDGTHLGLIRGSVFTPFTRNESRGVPDEYDALGYWEARLPSFLASADDPIWSPDGRWVILTSYVTC